MNVKTNQFGGALLFILGEFAAAEEEMIEDGGMEVFGEDDQGREGSCEVSINELAQAAADEIKHLKEQLAKANEDYKALFSAFQNCHDELVDANERVKELENSNARMLHEVANQYDGNDSTEWSIGANHVFRLFAKWISKNEQLRKEQE